MLADYSHRTDERTELQYSLSGYINVLRDENDRYILIFNRSRLSFTWPAYIDAALLFA